MHFVARLKDHKGNLTEWSIIQAKGWPSAKRIATSRFGYSYRKDYKSLILCKSVNMGVVDYCSKTPGDKDWSEIQTRELNDLLKLV